MPETSVYHQILPGSHVSDDGQRQPREDRASPIVVAAADCVGVWTNLKASIEDATSEALNIPSIVVVLLPPGEE